MEGGKPDIAELQNDAGRFITTYKESLDRQVLLL